MPSRPRFFVLNDPHPMRISKELAQEIGYNESVVLLQLEYLISISTTKEHDGDLWTYQSLEDLQSNFFPWWSTTTISRILKSLADKHLIKIGNYNRLGMDRTQWFALDQDGISQLSSVRIDVPIFQNEKWERGTRRRASNQPELPLESPPQEPPISQNEKCISQNEKSIFQNETTIPEIPTENPSETSKNLTAAAVSAPEEPAAPETPAAPAAAADSEDLFREILETGLGLTKQTRAWVACSWITPDYVRAHGLQHARDHPGKRPGGLLISIIESRQLAPQLNANRHLADCDCLLCRELEPEDLSDQVDDDDQVDDVSEDPDVDHQVDAAPGTSIPVDPSVDLPVNDRLTARAAWSMALDQLEAEMPKAAFDTWVRGAEIIASRPIPEDGAVVFVIFVWNAYRRDWLQSRLTSTAARVLTGIANRTAGVRFVCPADL